MIGEDRHLVTDEPVEFENNNQSKLKTYCRKIMDRFRGVYSLYPNLVKGKPENVNM